MSMVIFFMDQNHKNKSLSAILDINKLMNVDKLSNAGWTASIPLKEGIQMVYDGLKNKDWY